MLRTTLVSTVLFITLCGTGASAQQADVGQDLFEQYCATCHGLSGAGDGPLTVYLTEKVSDLTILAENNDGAFPMLKVIHIIDGRTGLRGHGGPMPTYGDIFEAEERSGMEGDYGPRSGRSGPDHVGGAVPGATSEMTAAH